MKTRELIAYAKEHGYNSTKFWCAEKIIAGEFIDAYVEFVKIPVVSEKSFVTIGQLERAFGYDLEFEVITDEETYKERVTTSFLARSKQPPKKYLSEVSQKILKFVQNSAGVNQ